MVAAVLTMVIGVSGVLVGLELLGAGWISNAGESAAGAAIPLGIAAYGTVCIVAGFGLLVHRRWAHRLALLTIVAGLLELIWQTTLIGLDPVTLFGLVVWGIVLALLVLPDLRSVIRAR